jgi:hypothetical protein
MSFSESLSLEVAGPGLEFFISSFVPSLPTLIHRNICYVQSIVHIEECCLCCSKCLTLHIISSQAYAGRNPTKLWYTYCDSLHIILKIVFFFFKGKSWKELKRTPVFKLWFGLKMKHIVVGLLILWSFVIMLIEVPHTLEMQTFISKKRFWMCVVSWLLNRKVLRTNVWLVLLSL